MKLEMTADEIENEYKQAEDKKTALEELAVKNLCTKRDIADVLVTEKGYDRKKLCYLYRELTKRKAIQSEQPASEQKDEISTAVGTIKKRVAELKAQKKQINEELSRLQNLVSGIFS